MNPLSADRLIFFRGTSYATRNPSYDRITTLSDTIILTRAFSGGGSELVFSKSAGIPSATGTVTMTHSGSNALRTISINAYGMVDSQ